MRMTDECKDKQDPVGFYNGVEEDVTLDFGREQRCGVPEVIFAENKSLEQLRRIFRSCIDRKHPVFATRVEPSRAEQLCREIPELEHHPVARALTWDPEPLPVPKGCICMVSAGTSDEPVAAEAALTARRMGGRVHRIADVGVAGLHRLLDRIDEIRQANVVIVLAGMEGALPSVVGGLVQVPLIAVPTSVGYGASFGGVAALLGMLNSCAAGVTVVNIDNGFGAGVAAARINRLAEQGGRG